MPVVNIAGLDKAEILAALYNRAIVLGLGRLHAVSGDMAVDEARQLLTGSSYFDYLKGRVMKVDLSGDTLDTRLYDRDNGTGKGEQIIEAVRAKKAVPGMSTVVPPRPESPTSILAEHDILIVPVDSRDW